MTDSRNDLQVAFSKALAGRNKGLPTGLPKLDKIIHGVQRGAIIGVAGSPKSGKSSLVDSCFVLNPVLYAFANPNKKIKFFYFSLEMDKVSVRFKASRHVTIFVQNPPAVYHGKATSPRLLPPMPPGYRSCFCKVYWHSNSEY